jgi:hypothetical protein
MASKIFGPRKRRTRAHVIADQSVNHVERFILAEAHCAVRPSSDYGYDLILFTFDGQGYSEPGFVYFQLKAAESLSVVGSDYVFDLDVRDYNLWTLEDMPVILVLFDASRKRAYWLPVQQYFSEDPTRCPKKGSKTVRVYVPKRQVVSEQAIAKMRLLKGETLTRQKGGKL